MTENTFAVENKDQIHSVRIGEDDALGRVVFIHGLFGRGKNFTTLAKGLETEMVSLLVDAPNHGESAWTEHFDYIEMADLIAAHLRADFASDRAVDIVGHSMGGKIAMVLALRHPDIVRRLIVLDIAPTAATDSRGQFQHLLGTLTQLDLSTITRRPEASAAIREQIPEAGLRGFLLQNLKQSDDGFYWEPNLNMLYAELETIMGFPELNDLAYNGPVLWVGGGRSNYVRDEDEEVMRTLFPKTVRMTIKDAGHWVHSEKPEETLAAIKLFLTR